MRHNRDVLRLFFVNWTLGALLGLAFAGGMLWFDVGGLFSLIKRSDMVVPAIALLFGGFAITCGGVVCASAIMRLPREDEPPAGGMRIEAEPVLAPVPSRNAGRLRA